MKGPIQHQRGFTLLEIMVALAILGLGLTAILSAQAGAFASAAHARNLSVATGLARCKMSEVEERLARPEGFPELDEVDSGPCCDDDSASNTHMQCAWKIEKPQFPEAKLGELDLNATLGGLGMPGLTGASSGGAPPPSVPSAPPMGPDGLPDLSAAGGMSGIASMAMTMVYPIIKPIFEASTRRVTVTLTWREGSKDYSMELMQWVTNPQKAGALPEELLPSGSTGAGAGTGSGAGSGTGSGTGSGAGPLVPRKPGG